MLQFPMKTEMDILTAIFVALLFVAISCVHGKHTHRVQVRLTNGGKIIGGSETTIQNYPYQVYLVLKRSSNNGAYASCGGSIANERCIITAAHCLTGMKSAYVRAGSTDSTSGGTMYNSNTLVRHPRYNSKTIDFDVGVIKLSNTITIDGTNTATVNLSTRDCPVSPGTNLTITGWGLTSENGNTSKILREVSITAVSHGDCKKSYTYISSTMLCAGVPEGGRSACNGDSGSPLVRTGSRKQVGLASFGIGCARPKIPGVYTNLCNEDI